MNIFNVYGCLLMISHFRRCHSELSLEAFPEISEVIEACQHRHLGNAILLGLEKYHALAKFCFFDVFVGTHAS